MIVYACVSLCMMITRECSATLSLLHDLDESITGYLIISTQQECLAPASGNPTLGMLVEMLAFRRRLAGRVAPNKRLAES